MEGRGGGGGGGGVGGKKEGIRMKEEEEEKGGLRERETVCPGGTRLMGVTKNAIDTPSISL